MIAIYFNITFQFTDDSGAYNNKDWKVCTCITKYDQGCKDDPCSDFCIKFDVIDGYCSDKWTCLCVYRC
ncbi:hypothetical protein DCAR_0519445 [Daucus carota subsp. sativus]|uniref:Uncharacterized protein n=1 Tax=Daucus carota subsp. sativus TaxID=79200 RepID=A0AAF0X447_DAUCS|nr:hypothetical protein DCAR_0519445 [Daucus carota subsp. sativus]